MCGAAVPIPTLLRRFVDGRSIARGKDSLAPLSGQTCDHPGLWRPWNHRRSNPEGGSSLRSTLESASGSSAPDMPCFAVNHARETGRHGQGRALPLRLGWPRLLRMS